MSSIWSNSTVPGTPDFQDGSALELGLRFQSDVAGVVTGVRFYKSAANTGTHIGNLWDNQGNLLGSVTFSNETPSGWQQASFASPISVNANTLYVVSYFMPNGHYSIDYDFFANSGVDNPPLHAPKDSTSAHNGCFLYGPSSAFPSNSYRSSNYWVDVVFGSPTTTTLTSSLNPATAGQAVTFTATVSPQSGSGKPTGTVTFYDGTTVIGTGTLS